jgi:PadR family transcriptional regulator PadR
MGCKHLKIDTLVLVFSLISRGWNKLGKENHLRLMKRLLFTSYTSTVTLLSSYQPTGGNRMTEKKSDILQGTLDLMVLKTLETMGPLHGYGIARRIEQLSEEALKVNQGTIYLCLVRLVQKKWITTEWGTSENNRKAKFYSISKAGRKQLKIETENWERISGVIGRVLQPGTGR